jgi:hypothetical protein
LIWSIPSSVRFSCSVTQTERQKDPAQGNATLKTNDLNENLACFLLFKKNGFDDQ